MSQKIDQNIEMEDQDIEMIDSGDNPSNYSKLEEETIDIGQLQSIVEGLDSIELEIQLQTIKHFEDLELKNTVDKSIVARTKMIQKLVHLLRSDHIKVAEQTAYTLSKFVGDYYYDEFRTIAMQSGIVEILSSLVATSQDIHLLRSIAQLISKLIIEHFVNAYVYVKRFELMKMIGQLMQYDDEDLLMTLINAFDDSHFIIIDAYKSGLFSCFNIAFKSRSQTVVEAALDVFSLADYIFDVNFYLWAHDDSVDKDFPTVDVQTLSTLCDLLHLDVVVDAKIRLDAAEILRKISYYDSTGTFFSSPQIRLMVQANFIHSTSKVFQNAAADLEVAEKLIRPILHMIFLECSTQESSELLENTELIESMCTAFSLSLDHFPYHILNELIVDWCIFLDSIFPTDHDFKTLVMMLVKTSVVDKVKPLEHMEGEGMLLDEIRLASHDFMKTFCDLQLSLTDDEE